MKERMNCFKTETDEKEVTFQYDSSLIEGIKWWAAHSESPQL